MLSAWPTLTVAREMEIGEWEHDIFFVEDFADSDMDPAESILANSVVIANKTLLDSLSAGTRLLEIGCGSSSYIKDNLPKNVVWEAIDVYEKDARGRQCIATKLGSVCNIPFESESFDALVSNQSAEHWFEYGVGLDQAFKEIARVLKVGGIGYINFPFHLHGHKYFVKGELDSILNCLPKELSVEKITAFSSRKESAYLGWRRCNFPDFYVSMTRRALSSFVVEIELKKMCASNIGTQRTNEKNVQRFKRLGKIQQALHHGLAVLGWRMVKLPTRFLKRQLCSKRM